MKELKKFAAIFAVFFALWFLILVMGTNPDAPQIPHQTTQQVSVVPGYHCQNEPNDSQPGGVEEICYQIIGGISECRIDWPECREWEVYQTS